MASILTIFQFTDLNVGSATPNYPTGWAQNAYQAVSFSVPDNWKAGRIWVSVTLDLYKILSHSLNYRLAATATSAATPVPTPAWTAVAMAVSSATPTPELVFLPQPSPSSR